MSTVQVAPPIATLTPGQTAQFTAQPLDANGHPVAAAVTWASADTSIATIAQTGLATAVATHLGSSTITATASGKSGTATADVGASFFALAVSATDVMCGLTPSLQPYCWSNHGGVGPNYASTQQNPEKVGDGSPFVSIASGQHYRCGIGTHNDAYCWGFFTDGLFGAGSSVPVTVGGGRAFVQIAANYHTTCGVTTAGEGYCWGEDNLGAIGNPQTCGGCTWPDPMLVFGAHTWKSIVTAVKRSCGLTTAGDTYCWGNNQYGEGGDTLYPGGGRSKPTRVSGAPAFSVLAVGDFFTCGIASGGAVYCFGNNTTGQLGIGTIDAAIHGTPTPVAGGLSFASITLGSAHACGLTAAGTAYCWGWNRDGQLGNNSTATSSVPVPVSGGLTFSSLSAGQYGTCGLASSGGTYCWGQNYPTSGYQLVPARIAGTR